MYIFTKLLNTLCIIINISFTIAQILSYYQFGILTGVWYTRISRFLLKKIE